MSPLLLVHHLWRQALGPFLGYLSSIWVSSKIPKRVASVTSRYICLGLASWTRRVFFGLDREGNAFESYKNRSFDYWTPASSYLVRVFPHRPSLPARCTTLSSCASSAIPPTATSSAESSSRPRSRSRAAESTPRG
ncbi:hypothetical protein IW262DRAFT_147834 [Armillaria fumosa]|nr:hypothetical protein IW262DRAFT_147834 [Armillaria fumosa]